MFGALVFDRDPLRLQDLPTELTGRLQDFGGVTAICLLVWGIVHLFGLAGRAHGVRQPLLRILVPLGMLLTVLCYIPALAVLGRDAWTGIASLAGMAAPSANSEIAFDKYFRANRTWSLTAGGAFAILTASLPFLANVLELRLRRIFALLNLSFKEALRRRVLYAFAGLLLVFLFGSWFLPAKPEDQVRNYVKAVYWSMTPLMLLAAALVAAFSLPTDIKQQTIHTIVTKPVQRFEMILGRFLGFVGLMTLVLLVMTGVSLLYVLRGVDPDAAAESIKSREPLYGELNFENAVSSTKAGNVGREWDYRSYITAPLQRTLNPETAIFRLPVVSQAVAERKDVRCEFGFDIFRTSKGFENKGVSCNFLFVVPSQNESPEEIRSRADKYQARLTEERSKNNPKPDAEIEDALAEEIGVYPRLSVEIFDYHLQSINLPGGLLRAARLANKDASKPALNVRVTCNDQTQYVGMSKYDLWLRLDDVAGKDDLLRFSLNFFKGSLGLWLQIILVVGLAVALSTYLSGVISFLIAVMLFLGGLALPFINTVAAGVNQGGGPAEAFSRLVRAEVAAAPLEESVANRFALGFDVGYRWVIRFIMKLIPDVEGYDFTSYVAEGFNIPTDQIVVHLLLLFVYLYFWCLLAFYLMKWREIAAPT